MIVLYWFLSFLLVVSNVWTLYNFLVIFSGAKSLLKDRKTKTKTPLSNQGELPFVSVIVPVKNEEKVIGRLLNALLNLNYPVDKKEIIVVNDASDDMTRWLCAKYAAQNPVIQVLSRLASTTKAAALNFGASFAKGAIIATFDADSLPEPDALLNAVMHFADAGVSAVQGRICSVNAEENMLTRFLSYEGAVQHDVYQRGKDNLNLFVCLAGTCQFIRKSVLEKVGGWNEECLCEDTELSLKLVEKDYVTKYAPEVRTWEESPSTFRNLLRQRVRWFRGNIENGMKFGRLLKNVNLRKLDAEIRLAGIFVIFLCLVNYLMAFWFMYEPPTFVMTAMAQVTSVFTLVILGVVAVALACMTRSLRLRSVLWLPFIYAYWGVQTLIVSYALLLIVFRRPKKWAKTTRSGFVTDSLKLRLAEREGP